jgi:ABC-type bacteriocin/lantibiotic exporter with double-glycine peptidase domain
LISIIKNILNILLQNKTNGFMKLVVLMFVLSMLELIGLGILIPVINIVSNPEEFIENKYIIIINNLFHFSDVYSSVFIVLTILVLFFIFKALSTLVIIFKQQIFVNTMFKDLSVNILNHSMSLKYEEFRKKDKSMYLKDIINSSAYLSLCTFNILQLFTEFFVLVSIIIFMVFYIGFLNVLYILIAIVIIGILFKSVTKNISTYGQQRDAVMHDITKTATEALGGYKEIRNNNVLNSVIEEYERKATPYVNIYAKFGTISNVPKVALESITALIIIAYLFYIFYVNIPIESVMQDLIIFAFVGLRTIPSLTKLLGASAQIKYFGTESNKFKDLFLESLNKYEYLESINTFSQSISFENISYKYPLKDGYVLKNLNFNIKKNKKYGFVGKSGSGKSTLFDIILGLNSPCAGDIVIDNKQYKTLENIDITKLIGVVSHDIFILDGSFKRNILFFDKDENNILLNEAINGAQLKSFISNDVNHLVGEDGSNLSGGQKQRLAIARALYKNKDILLLDEATSALDNETEREFIKYLNKKKNHTVLIIAHRLTTVKDCDIIFVFKDGSIVDNGSFDELSKNSIEFKKLLHRGEFNEK